MGGQGGEETQYDSGESKERRGHDGKIVALVPGLFSTWGE